MSRKNEGTLKCVLFFFGGGGGSNQIWGKTLRPPLGTSISREVFYNKEWYWLSDEPGNTCDELCRSKRATFTLFRTKFYETVARIELP